MALATAVMIPVAEEAEARRGRGAAAVGGVVAGLALGSILSRSAWADYHGEPRYYYSNRHYSDRYRGASYRSDFASPIYSRGYRSGLYRGHHDERPYFRDRSFRRTYYSRGCW